MGLGSLGLDTFISNPSLYDVITIGGKQYSAEQILDTTLIAQGNVPLYLASNFKTPFLTIKAGQPIGKVYSYIRADQSTAKIAGSPLLMFYLSDGTTPFFVKDEAAISTQALTNAGVQTVAQQTAALQAQQDKQNNPIGYYLKTYGLKALLIGGGIYAGVQILKAYIDKPKTTA